MAGGKGGGKETVTMRLDPRTQQYVQGNRQAAQSFYDMIRQNPQQYFAGPNALTGEATDLTRSLYGQIGAFGGMGSNLFNQGSALAMQQGTKGLSAYFDPYQQQVISAMQPQFQRQQAGAAMRQNQLATAQGAFGGSRAAAAAELAAQEQANNQNLQVSQLLSQGFGQSLNALMQDRQRGIPMAQLGGQMAQSGLGLGTSVAGQLGQYGEYLQQLQQQQAMAPVWAGQQGLGALTGAIGPYGQTQTTQQQGGGNPFGNILGGALSLGGMFGKRNAAGALIGMSPWGAAAGAGLGILGNIFS